MNIPERIIQLCKQRDWSVYKLGIESGLTERSIYQWIKKKNQPTVKAIESIANAFGITMSEFFAQENVAELTPDLKELFDEWHTLTQNQKTAIIQLIKSFK